MLLRHISKMSILFFIPFLLVSSAQAGPRRTFAYVADYTREDGTKGKRIELLILEKNRNFLGIELWEEAEKSGRTPTASEILMLLEKNPAIKADLAIVAEKKDPKPLLESFPKNLRLDLDSNDEVLKRIAHDMNRVLFNTHKLKIPVGYITTYRSKGGKAENILAMMKPEDARHIDKQKLQSILNRKDTDLKGLAARMEDIQSLYDALAVLVADKRCGIKRVETKQLYETDGIEPTQRHHPPIKIDSISSNVGGGDVTVYTESGDVVNLHWDAEHIGKMGVKEWLYGRMYAGFYFKLARHKICPTSYPAETRRVRSKDNATHE